MCKHYYVTTRCVSFNCHVFTDLLINGTRAIFLVWSKATLEMGMDRSKSKGATDWRNSHRFNDLSTINSISTKDRSIFLQTVYAKNLFFTNLWISSIKSWLSNSERNRTAIRKHWFFSTERYIYFFINKFVSAVKVECNNFGESDWKRKDLVKVLNETTPYIHIYIYTYIYGKSLPTIPFFKICFEI